MANGDLRLRAPVLSRDLTAIADLCGKVFSHNWGYYEFSRYCRDTYLDPACYDAAVSRVGEIDGRMVTHFGLWREELRTGAGTLRVAGVGAVATDAHYRRQGNMAATARAAMEAVAAADYDAALLFGIDRFYEKFGFGPAWPRTEWQIATGELPEQPAPAGLKQVDPAESAADARRVNRTLAGLAGTAVRPTFRRYRFGAVERWRWGPEARPRGHVVVAEQKGRLCLHDQGGPAGETLAAIGHLARTKGRDRIWLPCLHVRSALAARLRATTAQLSLRFAASGGAMLMLVSVERVARRLAREWEERLAPSPFAGWSGRLQLSDGRNAALLAIANGQITVEPAGPRAAHALEGPGLGRAVFGAVTVPELIATRQLRGRGDGARLAEVLFPPRDPCLPEWDEF
jgi:predicted N-acetyltransferase YhbS